MRRLAPLLLTLLLLVGCTTPAAQSTVGEDEPADSPEAFHGLG